jgi:hypothetical protein
MSCNFSIKTKTQFFFVALIYELIEVECFDQL